MQKKGVSDHNGYVIWWNHVLYANGSDEQAVFASFMKAFKRCLLERHGVKLPGRESMDKGTTRGSNNATMQVKGEASVVEILLRKYDAADTRESIAIWNEVVQEGTAFPQMELLDEDTGWTFFSQQSHTGLACDASTGEILGLYILHPNNVGRCGHICNASYAVKKTARGRHIGEQLVKDSMEVGRKLGFRILQFNAVVKTNAPALALYRRLGFTQLGVIPRGFLMKDGHYEDILPHYIEL